MSSGAPRKKRKSNSTTSHAKCRLHRDVENREKICNAVLKNRERCTSKIRCNDREAQLAKNQLPVCGLHTKQKLHAARCEALAACGERCNRRVPWLFCQKQLCFEHADVALPCRIMQLPTELRFQIFSHLVPRGQILACYPQLYRDICSLMSVNRCLHDEVSTFLFNSKRRPCQVTLSISAIRLLGASYDNDMPSTRRSGSRHISKAFEYRLERITHLRILCNVSYGEISDCVISAYVSNIWFLAKALLRWVIVIFGHNVKGRKA